MIIELRSQFYLLHTRKWIYVLCPRARITHAIEITRNYNRIWLRAYAEWNIIDENGKIKKGYINVCLQYYLVYIIVTLHCQITVSRQTWNIAFRFIHMRMKGFIIYLLFYYLFQMNFHVLIGWLTKYMILLLNSRWEP